MKAPAIIITSFGLILLKRQSNLPSPYLLFLLTIESCSLLDHAIQETTFPAVYLFTFSIYLSRSEKKCLPRYRKHAFAIDFLLF